MKLERIFCAFFVDEHFQHSGNPIWAVFESVILGSNPDLALNVTGQATVIGIGLASQLPSILWPRYAYKLSKKTLEFRESSDLELDRQRL